MAALRKIDWPQVVLVLGTLVALVCALVLVPEGTLRLVGGSLGGLGALVAGLRRAGLWKAAEPDSD